MSFGLKDAKYKRCGLIDGWKYFEQYCHHYLSLWEMMLSLLGLAEKFVNFPMFSGDVVNILEIFTELGDSFMREKYVYMNLK